MRYDANQDYGYLMTEKWSDVRTVKLLVLAFSPDI